jgi:hypothetical protein
MRYLKQIWLIFFKDADLCTANFVSIINGISGCMYF